VNQELAKQYLDENGNSFTEKQRFDRLAAADYLGVSVITVDRALAKKRISCYRVGRRVIFDKRHLDEFLNRNECKARN
jgi:excisionase family DNA binding protein